MGIGADVDFKLLEKLSLENCGLTRRVHEEHDARAQLIGVCGLPVSSGRGEGRGGLSGRPGRRLDPKSACVLGVGRGRLSRHGHEAGPLNLIYAS